MERFDASAIDEIRMLGALLTDLPLSDVLAILSCSRGYIGNDSGITHPAAAVGIRTVVVFGPTDPAVLRPHRSRGNNPAERRDRFCRGNLGGAATKGGSGVAGIIGRFIDWQRMLTLRRPAGYGGLNAE